MTEPRTAYHAGIWDTLLALKEAAAAIRTRADGAGIRRQAAAEALETFAEVYRKEALRITGHSVLDPGTQALANGLLALACCRPT